ncbi:ABC transporter permease [Streptantibioticus cattleyicolor]|uniref:ABC transporter permease protein n=1 Tax=Streptantibioticus cattleyicolor (strain ATCC 35852 / DSM 46488 / JCM 4925 / NBRC 14057 / NRRL 8057) TaxID=1003195 RepID=F8JN91_STREN|nr:ABC transporter permease [Streptantibioticus cattleyicolor]AEW99149.1 ABC transporter permease protein [Streptantibioticus cattleyicolor NRRL 8057 = DSM 46488]CCB71807.1 putative spermidine/putrescine transporter subunit; permease component of ABC superfamily [Streptantibioticus cattleyicolor NRRL 8057 = DSM 46488]
MKLSRTARIVLGCVMAVGLAFVYLPLLLVLVDSFDADRSFGWPPSGLTGRWWVRALHSEGAREALLTSVRAGLGATGVALVLGSLAAFAVHRYRFFGRRTVSFLLVLPIALPGIVTGIALNAAFRTVLGPLGVGFGLLTVVVGHATFCVVVVFNNVAARLRRIPGSLAEASADLGARPWRTFRYVTLPSLASALVAGGLLAFALSFDEIVVTTFTAGPGTQTLPIWIYGNLARPNQAPVVNVVAAVLVVLSVLPVYAAQRLSADPAGGRL